MKVTIVIVLMLIAVLLPAAATFLPIVPESYSTGTWLGTIVLLFTAAIVLDKHKREKEENTKSQSQD